MIYKVTLAWKFNPENLDDLAEDIEILNDLFDSYGLIFEENVGNKYFYSFDFDFEFKLQEKDLINELGLTNSLVIESIEKS